MRTLNRILKDAVFSVLFVLPALWEAHPQDFWPLGTGNKWSYMVFLNNYPYATDSSTTQIAIARDTLMPNGHRYSRLTHPDILGASFARADSLFVYYYSPYSGQDVPMYNLRALVGTTDTVQWGSLGSSTVTSVDVRPVLGVQRTMRQYGFDGLVRYRVDLAAGFGVVYAEDYGDGVWPYAAKWEIRGAIIRDTLYGMVLSTPATEPHPTGYSLYQNYPNPFNPSTTIRFGLPHTSPVQLSIFNTLGQRVATLVEGEMEAGYHNVTFYASDLSSGVYFYRMTAGSYIKTRTLLFVR
jgi:hypothetical protein